MKTMQGIVESKHKRIKIEANRNNSKHIIAVGGFIMVCFNVMTLLVNNRRKNAPKLQELLTASGCIIKTRLGLHEAGDQCSDEGLIILQLAGSAEEIATLECELNTLEGVKAKNIELCSDW
jgi:hypothetical protein